MVAAEAGVVVLQGPVEGVGGRNPSKVVAGTVILNRC